MMILTRRIATNINMRVTEITVASKVKVALFFEDGPAKVD